MQTWMEKYVVNEEERNQLKHLLKNGHLSELEKIFGDDFVQELIDNSEYVEPYGDYEIFKFTDEGVVRLVAISYDKKHGTPYVIEESLIAEDEFGEESVEEFKEMIDSQYLDFEEDLEHDEDIEELVDLDDFEEDDDEDYEW
ncbi:MULTISPECIES: hypothetical protein [Pseudothermotoga]|uniref:Uncharacterized protein n=1 Tax=Pseudothermotoga lettingae (strain ATCC BAA-301 / DSM 14385 / NBRC 107922 / TMO) TaxID=416591 RepID=A8F3F6_PSELT|nr:MULTISPECIES: hypothetical protein [Pseudothermotoga]ABV32690.1 hypothetical protein Tlet_0120 [Pseudothermotoga lettingae TMO]GLI48317.1 hypothetical protein PLETTINGATMO_04860 [Pseudothermotoga lettingae TMO]